MEYKDLIKNRMVVDHILAECQRLNRNLASKQSSDVWFELELSEAVEKGIITLVMHCHGDVDVLATVNLNARTLSVTGSEKFDVTVSVTEQILVNCFSELKRKGVN